MPKRDTPQAAAAAATAAAPEAEKVVKTRVQLASVLHINISQARVATHLKQDLGDEAVEGEIKALRKEMRAAKTAGTPADLQRAADLRGQVAEKSKTLVRISSETPIATAVIWDGAVKEILRYGMDKASAGDRKIVEVGHLHEGNPEALVYFPLYNKCLAWKGYNLAYEEELKKDRAMANKAIKDAREAKKATLEGKAPAEGKPRPAAKEAVEDLVDDLVDEGGEGEQNKTTFYTYVENALKSVKKDEPYKSMRVSNRVREYLSDLVAQGIARLAGLSRIVVQRVMGVRTMNADHIKAVIQMLLADDGRTADQVNQVIGLIDEKLLVYKEHLKSERSKKSLALDDGKRAELELKRQEAELGRKKKQTELAKKRATEAAGKAESLTVETALLEPIVAAGRAAAAAAAPAPVAA